MQLTVKTAAKLNLSLDILGRTADGYHRLRTVMQSVSVYDYLTLETGGEGIMLYTRSARLPLDERNLIYQAAVAFYTATGLSPGVRIRIVKHIPIRAGMGGGSGNAAGTLAALNALYGHPLEEARLAELAAGLGSDVPFFLAGGTVLCEGRGQIMTRVPDMPGCRIVLMKDRQGVSTRQAYHNFDWHPDPPGFSTDALLEALETGKLERVCDALGNNFIPSVGEKCPSVLRNMALLTGYGASGVGMTGSGSAVFAVFDDEERARSVLRRVAGHHLFAVLARPCKEGYLLIQNENGA